VVTEPYLGIGSSSVPGIDLDSFTTVAFEVKREDAVEARRASKDLGMSQRADCVVIAGAIVTSVGRGMRWT